MSAFSQKAKDQPTASLMHSLCAACSWRQSLCSGKAPWYYIRFPREHTLIVGLLSVTEPEISPFSGGDSVSKAGHLILISHSYCQPPPHQKYVFSSLASSPASWHFCQHETRCCSGLIESWKTSSFSPRVRPSTAPLFCRRSWLQVKRTNWRTTS